MELKKDQESFDVAYRSVTSMFALATQEVVELVVYTPEVLELISQAVQTTGKEQDRARGKLYRELFKAYESLGKKKSPAISFSSSQWVQLFTFWTSWAVWRFFVGWATVVTFGTPKATAYQWLWSRACLFWLTVLFIPSKIKCFFRNGWNECFHQSYFRNALFAWFNTRICFYHQPWYHRTYYFSRATQFLYSFCTPWRFCCWRCKRRTGLKLSKTSSAEAERYQYSFSRNKALQEALNQGHHFSTFVWSDGRYYSVGLEPIKGVEDRVEGYIISYQADETPRILWQDFKAVLGIIMLLS